MRTKDKIKGPEHIEVDNCERHTSVFRVGQKFKEVELTGGATTGLEKSVLLGAKEVGG